VYPNVLRDIHTRRTTDSRAKGLTHVRAWLIATGEDSRLRHLDSRLPAFSDACSGRLPIDAALYAAQCIAARVEIPNGDPKGLIVMPVLKQPAFRRQNIHIQLSDDEALAIRMVGAHLGAKQIGSFCRQIVLREVMPQYEDLRGKGLKKLTARGR
jgi:hypothetical protein